MHALRSLFKIATYVTITIEIYAIQQKIHLWQQKALIYKLSGNKTQLIELYKHPKKLVVFSSGHQPGRYVSASKKCCLFKFFLQSFRSCSIFNSSLQMYKLIGVALTKVDNSHNLPPNYVRNTVPHENWICLESVWLNAQARGQAWDHRRHHASLVQRTHDLGVNSYWLQQAAEYSSNRQMLRTWAHSHSKIELVNFMSWWTDSKK